MSKYPQTKRQEGQASPTSRGPERVSPSPSSGSSKQAAVPREVTVSLCTVAKGPGPTHEQIAARAYQLWETKGRRAGNDRDDWFEAERLLRTDA